MQEATTLLLTIAITDADLQSAYKLFLAVGTQEQSILAVSPLTETALVDLSSQLFSMAKERGLLDGDTTPRLIAACLQLHNIDKAREERT